jgi:hypothetical protein
LGGGDGGLELSRAAGSLNARGQGSEERGRAADAGDIGGRASSLRERRDGAVEGAVGQSGQLGGREGQAGSGEEDDGVLHFERCRKLKKVAS